MKRVVILGILSFIFTLTGLLTTNSLLVALSIPVWLYIIIGYTFSPTDLDLSANREIGTNRVSPNEPVSLSTTITNHGSRLEEVVIENFVPQRVDIIEGPQSIIRALAPGEHIEITHVIRANRGEYYFPDLKASANDYFGLFQKETHISAPANLLVFPPAIPLRRAAIRPRRTKVYSGQIPARRGGPGVEFFGTRPYEKGDPLRWIDWKSSARQEETFITKIFEQERVADVGLILDARLQTDTKIEDQSLFEFTVEACAALANTFLNLGNRVGMMIYGKVIHWTLPGYGKFQREKILQTLAKAEQGDSPVFENLDYIPTRLFPFGSQLVLISPLRLKDLDMLIRIRAAGFQLMVISPNPDKFSLSLLPKDNEVQLAYQISTIERKIMFRKMQQAGIQVLDWDTTVPFKEAAHPLLSRPPIRTLSIGSN